MAKLLVKCSDCDWEAWLYYDNIPPKCPNCLGRNILIDEVDHDPEVFRGL